MSTHAQGRTNDLSCFQALIRELAQHGQVTYRELTTRYPDHDYQGFVQAALDAERLGIARRPFRRGGAIEAAGACPCCGRTL